MKFKMHTPQSQTLLTVTDINAQILAMSGDTSDAGIALEYSAFTIKPDNN